MKLHELSPADGSKKAVKRIGRGVGSGQGKTAGKGHKGQKARAGRGMRPGFEGGQMPLQRRVPKRGFNNIFAKEIAIVNVSALEKVFDDGATVDIEALKKSGLVKNELDGVKVLGNGVKLDNLIHVAHNCRVGEDTIMAAMAGLAGSTTVGKRVQVGGKAGFSGHLEVGDDIVISADTNVTKSIDRPGVYTAMIPLQPHADWVKNFSHLRRLDAMAERVRELEKKLAEQDKTS